MPGEFSETSLMVGGLALTGEFVQLIKAPARRPRLNLMPRGETLLGLDLLERALGAIGFALDQAEGEVTAENDTAFARQALGEAAGQ